MYQAVFLVGFVHDTCYVIHNTMYDVENDVIIAD